ncbi:MAG: hypothetical protein KZQ88_09450 [Candidatus Thiodiazotropha sp. (ex Dulcina madagascariensis)]|nr:hypothetical protein [Candidatus Thiodiazotropha sp. (ex Dulcina madagascariensis)]
MGKIAFQRMPLVGSTTDRIPAFLSTRIGKEPKEELKMLIHPITLVLFMAFLPVSGAFAEKGESVMFEPKQHPFTHLPRETKEPGEECRQLAKRIASLKGKPQRRHAALERYRLTCTDRP